MILTWLILVLWFIVGLLHFRIKKLEEWREGSIKRIEAANLLMEELKNEKEKKSNIS